MTVGTSCYKRIERVTGGYNGVLWLQGVQRGWGVTTGYKGLHEETLDYKRLQGVTMGYRGLEGVTKGYKGLEEVPGAYKRLQKVARD